MTDKQSASVLLNMDKAPEATPATTQQNSDGGAVAADQNNAAGAENATGDKSEPAGSDAPVDTGAEGDKPSDGGGQADPSGAPEAYQFVAPEGVEIRQEGLTKFEEVARKLNLTNEGGQELINFMGAELASVLDGIEADAKAAHEKRLADWAQAVVADPEIGGAPEVMAAKLAIAKQAIAKFGDDRMGELLADYGLGNHPALIAFAYRAGLTLQEDKSLHRGDAAADNKGKRDADVLWPGGGNKDAA